MDFAGKAARNPFKKIHTSDVMPTPLEIKIDEIVNYSELLHPNDPGIMKYFDQVRVLLLEDEEQYSGQISGSQSPVLEEAEVVGMGFNQSWVKI